MAKLFHEFNEIEEDVKAKAPQIIYKYRDWEEPFHKQILTDNIIWFAHPKELNDPYDIRVPVRFDFNEIRDPRFFERLKFYLSLHSPHIPLESREFRTLCENMYEIIQQNPKAHFENNYLEIRESDLYDRVGVFSLSRNELDATMWAYYANNLKGFCIGFNTIELVRKPAIPMSFGYVRYDDTLPFHSFIENFDENQKDEMYLKHTKWGHEKEFRLLTFSIKSEKDRAISFNYKSISEIVVGSKISQKNLNEIISILKSKYQSKVRLYQIQENLSSYNFLKNEIKYQEM